MKKPLIVVSICAVVLLILGSLSNVVGYQSVKSTVVNDSPLFQTRTQRATNQTNKTVLTSDYLGKGLNTLSFPLQDNNNKEIQKFINRIRIMKQSTFNRFVSYVVYLIKHKDNFKDIDIKEFTKELNQLRESKQNIIVNKDLKTDSYTVLMNYTPSFCWFPGCLIFISIAYLLLFIVFYIIMSTPPSVLFPLH